MTQGEVIDQIGTLIEAKLATFRGVVREEIEAEVTLLQGKITLQNLETNGKLSRIADRLKTVEIDAAKTRETVTALNSKFDDAQVEGGGLLHDILDTVSLHHTLRDNRVERIEKHLDLPKPQ